MEDIFSFLSLAHEDFLGTLEGSEVVVGNDISYIKSNIPHTPLNVCFINNNNEKEQKDTILSQVNVPTIFYVAEKAKSSFKSWSNNLNIVHENDFSFMELNNVDRQIKNPIYDNIKVYKINDEVGKLKDLVLLYAKSKSLEPLKIYELFNKSVENQHFYITYFNNKPAGFFMAVTIGNQGFALDSYVEEKYRDMGILKIMANYVKNDGISMGVNKFYAFSMFTPSEKVLTEHGFFVKERLNIFIHSQWYNKYGELYDL